jgi:hypothetical protein
MREGQANGCLPPLSFSCQMRKHRGYKEYSSPELVGLYETAASEHGRANRRGNHRVGNSAADAVAEIYRELRSRGLEHQRMLLSLLVSHDDGVRAWAAAHALEFDPHPAEATLLDIAKRKGIDGFNAEMTLRVWREGNLRFP